MDLKIPITGVVVLLLQGLMALGARGSTTFDLTASSDLFRLGAPELNARLIILTAAVIVAAATAAGGTGEIVHDGENGRLVPVEVTAAQVADAVESVMDLSDAQYADMSAQAHATWARMSDAQRQYREFVDGLVALEG